MKSHVLKGFAVPAIVFCAIVGNLNAGWSRTYDGGSDDERGIDIKETSDGGYVVLGQTPVFQRNHIWLIKLDSAGNTLWTKLYEGSGSCLQNTDDGGYIITGARDGDVLVIKTNEDGDSLWTRTIGWEDYEWGNSLCLSSDGGYIIVGATASFNGVEPGEYENYEDLLIIKMNSQGDTVWSRVYGNEWRDEGSCIQRTKDGNYVITGTWNSWDRPWYGFLWLLKIDTLGSIIWDRFFHQGDTMDDWRGKYVTQTSDDGYIVSGGARTNIETGGVMLLKTDSIGILEWYRFYGGVGFFEYAYCVQETSDEGFIFTSDLETLTKTDKKGNTLWTRSFRDSSEVAICFAVQLTSDGGYIMTGKKGVDLWVIKTNANGDTLGIDETTFLTSPTTHQFEIANPIGREVTLRYFDCPQGFRASVFDASGRKVDEIHSTERSGMIVWSECYGPGVYFIVADNNSGQVLKVILVK